MIQIFVASCSSTRHYRALVINLYKFFEVGILFLTRNQSKVKGFVVIIYEFVNLL
jgi:hypothetical protein